MSEAVTSPPGDVDPDVPHGTLRFHATHGREGKLVAEANNPHPDLPMVDNEPNSNGHLSAEVSMGELTTHAQSGQSEEWRRVYQLHALAVAPHRTLPPKEYVTTIAAVCPLST